MSIENAKKFISGADSGNENYKNILKNTFSKFESRDAKLEYVTAKARELGFDFSSSELKTAFSEMKDQLSEKDLEKVAGGADFESSADSLIEKGKNFWNSLW